MAAECQLHQVLLQAFRGGEVSDSGIQAQQLWPHGMTTKLMDASCGVAR